MTRHYLYPDLSSASDWSCRVGNLLQPIRSTPQIWVVTRHQYGISVEGNQPFFFPVLARPKAKVFLRLRKRPPSNPVQGHPVANHQAPVPPAAHPLHGQVQTLSRQAGTQLETSKMVLLNKSGKTQLNCILFTL